MQSKTTIHITLQKAEPLILKFHRQMTASELQELIRASFCLSDDVSYTTSKTQGLTFLLSQSRNLLTDYLLTSTSYPLSKICGIQQHYALFNGTLQEIKQSNLLQKYNKNQKTEQKALNLNLQIIYPKNQIENQTTLLYYQCLNDKKKSLTTHNDEKMIKYQTQIVINKQNNNFQQRVKIKKQSLKIYRHFQNLMKMRQRLIESTKNRSNIFDELTQTYEDRQNFVFQLNYVPAIKIAEILKFNLQQQQKKRIIQKVLIFLYYLCCNGFQTYLHKLFHQRKMNLFLQEISIDFNENLKINDLRLLLQQDSKSQIKMKKEQWRSFEYSTQIYLSTLNTCNNQSTVSINELFIALFSTKQYKFSSITLNKYIPECKFFFWKPSQLQKDCITLRNQGTTIKKKINQDPIKKRVRSQKTKIKYNIQLNQPYRRDKRSNKKQNKSFA